MKYLRYPISVVIGMVILSGTAFAAKNLNSSKSNIYKTGPGSNNVINLAINLNSSKSNIYRINVSGGSSQEGVSGDASVTSSTGDGLAQSGSVANDLRKNITITIFN